MRYLLECSQCGKFITRDETELQTKIEDGITIAYGYCEHCKKTQELYLTAVETEASVEEVPELPLGRRKCRTCGRMSLNNMYVKPKEEHLEMITIHEATGESKPVYFCCWKTLLKTLITIQQGFSVILPKITSERINEFFDAFLSTRNKSIS